VSAQVPVDDVGQMIHARTLSRHAGNRGTLSQRVEIGIDGMLVADEDLRPDDAPVADLIVRAVQDVHCYELLASVSILSTSLAKSSMHLDNGARPPALDPGRNHRAVDGNLNFGLPKRRKEAQHFLDAAPDSSEHVMAGQSPDHVGREDV